MTEEPICPHCKSKFLPVNHYKSGLYTCGECQREIFVEVDYLYRARCAEVDHQWGIDKSTSIPLIICSQCQYWEPLAVQTSASLPITSAEEK